MGIAIQELLSQEYFKDFYVLAGAKGLHREIQGITVMEAPDAFHWTKGKELVLSSGYVIAKEPDCIEKAFREGSIQKSAGMMIKRERYLEKIPEEMLELFDQYEVPLISMPFSAPWMEVMSQINTAVLNRTIRRLRINTSHMTFQMSNFSYKEQKIKRILQAMEAEMGFPAFLYDFVEEEAYYSSMNFQKIAKGFGLETEDFWEPSMPYTRHTLCDYMDMVRYRLVNQSHQEGPRISWIRVPISVNGSVQAYFAVMEAREFLDYYDEYSIRIAYLMLQGLYEQIVAAQNMGNIGFENFVLYALSATEDDTQKMMFQANVQGISMSTKYRYVLFRRADNQEELPNRRKEILEAYRKSSLIKYARIAMIGENVGILFLEDREEDWEKGHILALLEEFRRRVLKSCPETALEFGYSLDAASLGRIRQSIEKCQKALNMGKMIYPSLFAWEYSQLGALAWLDIPEEELTHMLSAYSVLLKDEKNIELLKTLKVYLENNMNYSATAEKLYVHINTIRTKREMPMPKKQKAKIKQKNKCPEKLIRTEAAKEIAEIDRSLQDQKYQLRCRAAIDLLTAKLNMINADLSRKKRHVVINQISSRVKTAESIYTKLIRKGLEPDFDTARAELKDLIGIRVVCPFEDEVYEVADRLKAQGDVQIIREKDYIKNPKKNGYKSLHMIVEVPIYSSKGPLKEKVEIQLRTVAMDYWSVLEYQIFYKKTENEEVAKELKTYADEISELDAKMLKLRDKIEKM